MINTLKALCAKRGVSGREDEVRDYIVNRARDYADKIVTDVMGNVLIYKKGASQSEKKLMLCAHMDEVGVIVTGITDDGFIKFETVGGVAESVIMGKAVEIGQRGVYGVIGNRPIHLVKAKEREKLPAVSDMYIDIGAKSRGDAEQQVALGDTGVFSGSVTEFGNGFIKSRAIDDRFGCAVLLKLIESELPMDCVFAFTVQEEVGVRGAYTAAFNVKPDIALVIEATTAADLPSVPEEKKVCRIGGGAVIPFMDKGTIYDRGLYNTLIKLADRHGVLWQTKNRVSGGTDAQAIQRSRAGVCTAAIAAPVRNLHSPSCVAKTSDLEAVYKLARLFIKEVCEGRL